MSDAGRCNRLGEIGGEGAAWCMLAVCSGEQDVRALLRMAVSVQSWVWPACKDIWGLPCTSCRCSSALTLSDSRPQACKVAVTGHSEVSWLAFLRPAVNRHPSRAASAQGSQLAAPSEAAVPEQA